MKTKVLEIKIPKSLTAQGGARASPPPPKKNIIGGVLPASPRRRPVVAPPLSPRRLRPAVVVHVLQVTGKWGHHTITYSLVPPNPGTDHRL
eukprot:9434534-Karenia_brevis.AAC.1